MTSVLPMPDKPETDIPLNTVFFTEKDDSITGTAQRDPLGLQPIWSYFGRQVINHLTTISTTIHGFREVLLSLSICSEIANTENKSYYDLILLFEQLFIYTAIAKNRIDGILGSDNGYARFNAKNGNPNLDTKDTILVREISLGYYGRYKTPLSTMGILNKKSEVVIDKEDIISYYGKSRYLEIQKAFKNFIDSNNKKFNSFTAKNALFDSVFGKFRKDECEFWLSKLYEVNGKEKELMKLSYNAINSSENQINPFKFFNSLPKQKEVTNILKLEPFLRCLEEIFYKAMNSKSIDNINFSKAEHKKRFDEFLSISSFKENITNSLFTERMKFLKENCNPNSENYIKNVIEYHHLVCKQKKSSNWIEIDSEGRLQSFVNVNDVEINISEWGRDYYLSSLKSIKAEIQEFYK